MTGIKISASGNLFWAVFSAPFSSVTGIFFLSFCDLLFRPKDKTNLSTIMLQVAFSSTASAWHYFAPAKLSICTPFFAKGGSLATLESQMKVLVRAVKQEENSLLVLFGGGSAHWTSVYLGLWGSVCSVLQCVVWILWLFCLHWFLRGWILSLRDQPHCYSAPQEVGVAGQGEVIPLRQGPSAPRLEIVLILWSLGTDWPGSVSCKLVGGVFIRLFSLPSSLSTKGDGIGHS